MADQFLGEIRMFPFNFPPNGWAFCDGQLMSIPQNTALFSLFGTVYGGDGRSTFGVPDLQGRAPMQPGQGPGLTLHDLGESDGVETVTLLQSEMPAHAHLMMAEVNPGQVKLPGPTTSLARSAGGYAYLAAPANLVPMAPEAIQPQGGDQPHNNMMPYLTVYFCVALQGIYPSRP
jgi:microcystin-dependent protein